MSNVFDRISETAFGRVSSLMGYDASWTPSEKPSQPIQRARVLFREPTRKEILGDVPYNVEDRIMEYMTPDFQDLQKYVDEGFTETVTVNGKTYQVQSIERHYDGRTFKARVVPTED